MTGPTLLDGLADLADPYPAYAELRAAGPVWHEPWGVTVFSTYGDVDGILRDRRFGRDPRGVVEPDRLDTRIYPTAYPTWTRYIRSSFMELEPPAHTRIRSLVATAFSRRRVATLRPALADAAADSLRGTGSVDVMSTVAPAVPLATISALLAIPKSDEPRIIEWSHRIVALFDPTATAQAGEAAEAATIEFVAYVTSLLVDRGRGDDLISALVRAEVDGVRLTDAEIIATVILLLNAGHEATVHAIGNAVHALATRPDLYASLAASPASIPAAVDELLRYDPPLHYFERWALAEVEWAGIGFRPGDRVGLLLGAANRDPVAFVAADELRLDRHRPHLSFGAGIHRCLGAALAAVELECALRALTTRFPTLRLDASARYRSLVFRGWERLVVAE